MTDKLAPELLSALEHLRKCYEARISAVTTSVILPSGNDLIDAHVQDWLIQEIIEPEKALVTELSRLSNYGESNDLHVGAVNWRKSFWKRLVARAENALRQCETDELEIRDEILETLAELMVEQDSSSQRRIRRFRYSFEGIENVVYSLEEEATISKGTTGLVTWQAAIRLANHFLARPDLVRGRRIIELGSGAGMLPNLIAKLQHGDGNILATDYEDGVLRRIETNVILNSNSGKVHIAALNWGDQDRIAELGDFDLVIASDVVSCLASLVLSQESISDDEDVKIYDPTLVPLLTGCIRQLLNTQVTATAYISATVRNEDTLKLFLLTCSEANLEVAELAFQDPLPCAQILGGAEGNAVVRLYIITLRP